MARAVESGSVEAVFQAAAADYAEDVGGFEDISGGVSGSAHPDPLFDNGQFVSIADVGRCAVHSK